MACLLQDLSPQRLRKTAPNKIIEIWGHETGVWTLIEQLSKDFINTYTYGEDGFQEGLRW